MSQDKWDKVIRVALTFYTTGREQIIWEFMPQTPRIGDTVHYSLDGNPDNSRAWRVMNVSWVPDNYMSWVSDATRWHAEIGLE